MYTIEINITLGVAVDWKLSHLLPANIANGGHNDVI